MQIVAAESRAWLGKGGLEATKIADAGGAAGLNEQCLMKVDEVAERQVSHQARRLYSSSFLFRMRIAAARNSASGVPSRSDSAARASSSGVNPRSEEHTS